MWGSLRLTQKTERDNTLVEKPEDELDDEISVDNQTTTGNFNQIVDIFNTLL